MNLLSCLEQLLRGGFEVITILWIAADYRLDRGCHIGPERASIEQTDMVGGFVEVVEHQVAETESAKRPHDLVRRIEKRDRFARLL
jgi:hypothetical protein